MRNRHIPNVLAVADQRDAELIIECRVGTFPFGA